MAADNVAFENESVQRSSFTESTSASCSSRRTSNTDSNIVKESEFENVEIDNKEVYDNITTSSSASSKIADAYPGMPKEILLLYSRQKKYVWTRNILSAIVVLTIFTLLALVIALIAVSPACQQFWQTSPIYQIYPKSFYDADNDGAGDLRGITEKVPHLQEMGIKTIWLNSIYNSSQKDNGYDVVDHCSIDPVYGTFEDFEELVTLLHSQVPAMRLVMDFVPNHTSDKHKWFIASSQPSHEDHEKYKDYYVWVDGASDNPPNNWQSVYSDEGEQSAWEYNENRGQYYYHAFYKEQPDLNLRNSAVLEELKSIFSFWIENNVDGFHVEAANYLFEATHLRDNPVKENSEPGLSYASLWPDYTENQYEIHDVIADWRSLLKIHSSEPGVYRFMETEVNDTMDAVVRYYGTYAKEADYPKNLQLLNLEIPELWNAATIERIVMEWMEKMPVGKWPNWMIGSDSSSRVVSRLGETKARLATILTMTLSGTPGIYYGEEIGMTDAVQDENPNDIKDKEKTPMQWDTAENAGFCSNCTPWLTVNENHNHSVNVKAQEESSNSTSMLCLYKKLIGMRSEVLFIRGSLCVLHSDSDIFMYIREIPGSALSILVAINFGKSEQVIDVKKTHSQNFPDVGTVIFRSETCEDRGEEVHFKKLSIAAEEAIMVQFKPPKASVLFSQSSTITDRCFVSAKACINIMGLLEVC